MTGGIAKVVIFSFTERGTKQNRYIYRKLKMQGYICEGYAPAKYVMGEEGGVKQLTEKKGRFDSGTLGKVGIFIYRCGRDRSSVYCALCER